MADRVRTASGRKKVSGNLADTLPDQSARDRAVAGSSPITIVEAAAGTGKTTLLINRLLHILRNERHPKTNQRITLRDIAAITFTEKAAAEMRERLRDKLEDLLAENPGLEERDHLREALADLEVAAITTIHSFCAMILRERPVEANLDPEAAVGDPLGQALLQEEAFERWLERRLSDKDHLDENPVAVILTADGRIGTQVNSRGLSLRSAARKLMDNRELAELLQPLPTDLRDGIRKLRGEFDSQARAVRELCAKSNNTTEFLDAFLRLLSDVDKATEAGLEEMAEDLVQRDFKCGATVAWGGEDNLQRAIALCKRIRLELYAVLNAERLNCLIDGLRDLLVEYEKLKKHRNQLDFLDLLLRAVQLVSREDIRDYLAERYPFILIDEFQDTDPLQTKIILNLLTARHAPRLFLVGDPKQSIYRFRRADIETYTSTVELLEQKYQAKRLFLTCNFRSVPSILRFVNHVCEPIIKKPSDGAYQPDYVPLAPPPNATDNERPAVHYLSPPDSLVKGENEDDEAATKKKKTKRKRIKVQTLREVEGYVTGKFLVQAVCQGWQVRSEDGTRPIRYGDIAILFERTTGFESYEAGLQAAGVPYRLVGAKTFYNRIEVKSVLAVLRALENPMSPLRVVAALRTPLFGISDANLAEHRLVKNYEFNYLRCQETDTPLARAFEIFRRLYEHREQPPIYRSLERLYEETGAVELFASLPDGADRAANLLHLVEMCRKLESVQPQTFRSMVRWLDNLSSSTEEETELPLPEGDEGAVLVITMHRSKGLEFPMVVVGEFGCPREIHVEPPLVNRSCPDSPRIGFQFTSTLATPGWSELAELEQKRLRAERIRLLYVALTRARDYLVLPVGWPYSQRASAESLEDYVRDRLDLAAEHPRPDGVPVQVHDTSSWGEFSWRATSPQVDPDRFDEKLERQASRLLAEAKRVENKLCKAQEISRHGLTVVRPSDLGGHEEAERAEPERDAAMRFGEAVHRALEWLVATRRTELTEEDRKRVQAIADLCGLVDAEKQGVLEHVQRALANSHFASLVQQAETVATEVPLAGRDTASDTLVEGVADLLIQMSAEWIIVDYKTDDVEPGQEAVLLERYGDQIHAYVRLLREIAPKDCRIKAYLLATKTGELIPVS